MNNSLPLQFGIERIEQRQLAWKHHCPGFGKAHPARLLDLRKAGKPARSGRPFELEIVGADGFFIEVSLNGERLDMFTARLTDLRQVNGNCRQMRAGFLGKFAKRSLGGRFAWLEATFGDHPRANIPAPPEGTARLDQQDLGPALRPPE